MMPRSWAAGAGSRWTSQSRTPAPACCAFPRLGSCDQNTPLIHGDRRSRTRSSRSQTAAPRASVLVSASTTGLS